MASIDTAGIHEDDPTVTRDVSANIFYFLDDQDHYVHDSEGRTLTTGLTRSVTVSVDLDTQRTTATVDQDFTWSAEDGAFKVVLDAEPERDDNGREIHRATDGGRILKCGGPIFAHPCVIGGVEHEIKDSVVVTLGLPRATQSVTPLDQNLLDLIRTLLGDTGGTMNISVASDGTMYGYGSN